VARITRIFAREILDSRGNPTVEADVHAGAFFGRAAAPSGASTGVHEALELRDGGKRYGGKGVLRAVENVNHRIAKALIGMEVSAQDKIDMKMCDLDGTENKANLGANAIVATSLAVAKCGSAAQGKALHERLGGKILPVPMLNVINGGKHAGSGLAVQEFMLMPVGAKSFSEALQMGSEIYHGLGKLLVAKYGPSARNVGDEGGYAPAIRTTSEALGILAKAIEDSGYEKEVKLGMDAAASSFYDKGSSTYSIDGKELMRGKLIEKYCSLAEEHPLISLEDPFHEEDFEGFAMLRQLIGKKCQIVGDDLLVTNVKRIEEAIECGSVNALLLKVNQIGTLTESIAAAKMCYKQDYGVVVSHRSGETEDSTIAHIAVGIGSGQIKTGAPARAERTAKYNELLRIEERLGAKAEYAGRNFRTIVRH